MNYFPREIQIVANFPRPHFPTLEYLIIVHYLFNSRLVASIFSKNQPVKIGLEEIKKNSKMTQNDH